MTDREPRVIHHQAERRAHLARRRLRDGGYWRAAGTAETEEHVKSISRGRLQW